jgi:hypothetical protein
MYTHSTALSCIFVGCGSFVVAANLFVCIVCSLSEQNSKVAHALSILRDSAHYELRIEAWWRKFAKMRTAAIWAFFVSVPVLFMEMACGVLMTTNLALYGMVGSAIFIICGAITSASVFYIGHIFRQDVLMLNSTFAVPHIDSQRRKTSVVYDGLAYSVPDVENGGTIRSSTSSEADAYTNLKIPLKRKIVNHGSMDAVSYSNGLS